MSGFKVEPLNFGPDALYAYHTWVGLPKVGSPAPTPVRLEALENSLRPILGNLKQETGPGTPNGLEACLAQLNAALPTDFPQQLSDMLLSKPITVGKLNIATGKPGVIGQIGIDGKVSYDGAGDQVAGNKVPITPVLDFLGITKRFKYNGIKDVQIALMFDTDVWKSRKFDLLFTGCSISKPVKISGFPDAKMTINAGRDQFGGPAFSFSLNLSF